MRKEDEIRPAEQAGIEAQRRWFATAALILALTVLSVLAPRLAGS